MADEKRATYKQAREARRQNQEAAILRSIQTEHSASPSMLHDEAVDVRPQADSTQLDVPKEAREGW